MPPVESATASPVASRELPSLRTELLATIALLALAALLIAVGSVVVFSGFVDSQLGALWLTLLILGDVAVFVAVGAYQLKRLVVVPLASVVSSTSAIAAGDLKRRVPDAATQELSTLADSVNRMTDHLLAEHAHRVRAEKLAGIGRLAAGVAHEIGNPLGAINGYTYLLRNRINGDAKAAEALAGVERESARIDRIVKSLLDYARQRRHTPSGRIDVNGTVKSVVQLLRDQGVLRDVEIAVSLHPSAPFLSGERHELEQMLVNLLLNAVDAMKGTGRIAVVTHGVAREALEQSTSRRGDDPTDHVVPRRPAPRVRHWLETTKPPDNIVKLIVADSGPGIPDEDSERIFEPFYTTKEPGKGTGLGLAIVARVVDDLRGIVWVQRAREGGAAFHLLFPTFEARETNLRNIGERSLARPA
jgi:two-component system NtrC family sensor kinase